MRRGLLVLAGLAALALAACGGSCGTRCSNAGVQAAKAPPTQSPTVAAPTPQTATTPQLPPSTPITSPAFRAAVIRAAENGGVPAAGAGRAADCIIAGLPSLGVKTAGGFENAGNPTQVRALIARCVALVRRGR